jgi:hypothetical protein
MSQTVNMLITDPFSEEMLFSAQWQVDAIVARGSRASINPQLAANLGDLRVNNAIESGTLASIGERIGDPGTAGVLVVGFQWPEDVAVALRGDKPVHAPMKGTVYLESCLR